MMKIGDFKVGQRVTFVREVDYSFESGFVVPEGATGVVTEADESHAYVKVDGFVKGLSDSSEWEGVFMWTRDDEDIHLEINLGAPFEAVGESGLPGCPAEWADCNGQCEHKPRGEAGECKAPMMYGICRRSKGHGGKHSRRPS